VKGQFHRSQQLRREGWLQTQAHSLSGGARSYSHHELSCPPSCDQRRANTGLRPGFVQPRKPSERGDATTSLLFCCLALRGRALAPSHLSPQQEVPRLLSVQRSDGIKKTRCSSIPGGKSRHLSFPGGNSRRLSIPGGKSRYLSFPGGKSRHLSIPGGKSSRPSTPGGKLRCPSIPGMQLYFSSVEDHFSPHLLLHRNQNRQVPVKRSAPPS